jgi:hypothetical protein
MSTKPTAAPYVRRILTETPPLSVPLEHEAERFHTVVAADANYAADGGERSRPWLSAENLTDPLGAQLYRELLERIWPSDGSLPPIPVADMRRILEFLDSSPPSAQVGIGRWILQKRSELKIGVWASGARLWDNNRLFVFACARADVWTEIERFDADLAALACVRARELAEQGNTVELLLAVGHVVADGQYIDHRYIYMEPPREVPDELKSSVLHEYGRFDLARGKMLPIEAGRNEPCPCGSGKKFKNCMKDYHSDSTSSSGAGE